MSLLQPDIIHQLRQEILLREGYRPPTAATVDMGLGPVAAAFPNGVFPTGAVHELIAEGTEGMAASGGFLAALLGPLMKRGGAVIWVCRERRVFPPGLGSFGVDAGRVIFLTVRNEKAALWAIEEALKCEGLAAVVGEVREMSGHAVRRLQLAVEQSRVTGFVLREDPRSGIAAVARWKVNSVRSGVVDGAQGAGMPGVGFARWRVELSKIRNGRPGCWLVEWRAGRFHIVEEIGVSDAGIGDGMSAGAMSGVGIGAMAGRERRRQTG
jgi:protein ImuA